MLILTCIGFALLHAAASAWELLGKNCWPDYSGHYISCCNAEYQDAKCFQGNRSFEKCCSCSSDKVPVSGEVGTVSGLGLSLSQKFFGPLLCDGPLFRSRKDDFLVPLIGGGTRALRVFVYYLDRRFNADILNRLQWGGWLAGSECDYGLTLCTESQWNSFFSVHRQFATEVIVLSKFLAAPPGVLTSNPDEADVFVVPYFAKSECAEGRKSGNDPCWGKCKCAKVVDELVHKLHHYNLETRGRHLFLATGDTKDLPVEIQAQPLFLSLGASFCGGHVVVPSPSLDPDLQPGGRFESREASGKAPKRHIFIYYFASVDKEWRIKVVEQLLQYRDRGNGGTGAGKIVVHAIQSDYEKRDLWKTEAGPPQMVLEEMYRSVFCPVLQGDTPYQKRLFDAIFTGCLPVVIQFPSHVIGKVSWWLPGGPPVERMVPFPDAIDYDSFVLQVPQADVEKGRFAEVLRNVPGAELVRRRKAMQVAKSMLRFDFKGSAPDAFSAIVASVWKFVDRKGHRSNKSRIENSEPDKFDCNTPPVATMYGHFACCPDRFGQDS